MKNLLYFTGLFALLAGCSPQAQEKPDADRVIRDTVAQTIFESLPLPDATPIDPILVAIEQQQTLLQQSREIKELLVRLQEPVQYFKIDSKQKSEIKGLMGTVVQIEPNSFIRIDGALPSENITLELKEVFTGQQMLRENSNTVSNEGIFENKGAVRIRAFDRNEPLRIQANEWLTIRFPEAVTAQKDGFLFTADDERPSWRLNGKPDEVHYHFQRPEFSYLGLNLETYLRQMMHYPEYAKTNELSGKVEANVQLDDKGKVTQVTATSGYLIFRDEVSNKLSQLPDWTPARYLGKNYPSTVKIQFDFNLRRAQQIKISAAPEEMTVHLNREQRNSHSAVFASVAQLGWTAYGVLLPHSKTKADIVILSDVNTDSRIISANGRSTVHALNYIGYSRYTDLPVGEVVTILSVKHEAGNIFYSSLPLRLAKQNVVSPQWKKTTERELVTIMAHLSAKHTLS